MTIQIKQEGRTTLIMAAELERHITPFWFDLNAWQAAGAVQGSAPGRGQSYFLRWHNPDSQESLQLVWRHYRRGGLMARMLEDRYGYRGLEQTRPYQEFLLTEKLFAMGLPVPRPIAGAVHRQGCFYRADLITERLANTTSMAAMLRDNKALPWADIGKMIKRFHAVGLNHVDLNIRNILINDQQQPFLIDFDRCQLLTPAQQQTNTKALSWQKNNLQRLQRSIAKEFNAPSISTGVEQLLRAYDAQ